MTHQKLATAALPIAIILTPSIAAAAQLKIESGINQAVAPLVGIGLAISVIGLIFAGIKFNSGDPDAKDHAKRVLVGSVIILSASAIGGALKLWFA